MDSVARPLRYARASRAGFLSELQEFIRIPSISAQPRYAGAVKACAAWLAGHLKKIGLQRVRLVPTQGHPIVYGEWRGTQERPTILIYGHYDVQPVDPLHQWRHPPFAATVEDGRIYGRGASDDKGQVFAHIKALESYLHSGGQLPVNVKCVIEGEEEIASRNLPAFLARNRDALSANAAVISDTAMLGPDRPAITYSLRGQLFAELEARAARHDLHSGQFGGAIPNPLEALCAMLGRLHDDRGRVAIPGFYDRVRLLTEAGRERLRKTGTGRDRILLDAQAETDWGDKGYTAYERITVRPALTVCGVSGGYQGAGVKAVIPARAVAKIDIRLVPEQDPQEIAELLRTHIRKITPPEIKTAVRFHGTVWPAATEPRHPVLAAASRACEKVFGRKPALLRSGGSIGAVSLFQRGLGIPTVLMGFGLPNDRQHAPNEKLHLSNFFRGIETSIWFLSEFKRAPGSGPSSANSTPHTARTVSHDY